MLMSKEVSAPSQYQYLPLHRHLQQTQTVKSENFRGLFFKLAVNYCGMKPHNFYAQASKGSSSQWIEESKRKGVEAKSSASGLNYSQAANDRKGAIPKTPSSGRATSAEFVLQKKKRVIPKVPASKLFYKAVLVATWKAKLMQLTMQYFREQLAPPPVPILGYILPPPPYRPPELVYLPTYPPPLYAFPSGQPMGNLSMQPLVWVLYPLLPTPPQNFVVYPQPYPQQNRVQNLKVVKKTAKMNPRKLSWETPQKSAAKSYHKDLAAPGSSTSMN